MLSGLTLAPGEWNKFVAKFVDDAHEFVGFDIPAVAARFSLPEADLAPCQINEMMKEREEAEQPIPPTPVLLCSKLPLQQLCSCTDCW